MNRTHLQRFAAQRDFHLDLPEAATGTTPPWAQPTHDLPVTALPTPTLPTRKRGMALLVAATTTAIILAGVALTQQPDPTPPAAPAATTLTEPTRPAPLNCAKTEGFAVGFAQDAQGTDTPEAAADEHVRTDPAYGPTGAWEVASSTGPGDVTLTNGTAELHALQLPNGTWVVDQGRRCT